MTICCPLCGGSLAAGRVPVEALVELNVSEQQRRILEELVRAFPRSVPKTSLIDALYFDDPDGGPDNPRNVLSQQLSRIRAALHPYGWSLSNAQRDGSNYGRVRLVKLELAQA
jgi:hypothetical protein